MSNQLPPDSRAWFAALRMLSCVKRGDTGHMLTFNAMELEEAIDEQMGQDGWTAGYLKTIDPGVKEAEVLKRTRADYSRHDIFIHAEKRK